MHSTLDLTFFFAFLLLQSALMKDREVEKLIKAERKRQQMVINLIASENYVSKDVLAALGSELTNKYAEGYSQQRYYGGSEVVDLIEDLSKERALALFNLSSRRWHVNVQPLSGTPANLAVYSALVPIGGKIMGMSLEHGGHLSHGHKVSVTGKWWVQIAYGVDRKTETLDYEELRRIAELHKPSLIVTGFTAYPRIIDFVKFRQIADAVGAYLLVDASHFAGLVASALYPSPFPYADVVTMTTHKTLRGPRAALIFVRRDGRGLDKLIDRAVFPGLQGGPHLNQIAAVAVSLKEANTLAFRRYIRQVVKNARVLAEELKKLGWRVISGGTDTHLLLVDTWMGGKGLSGAEASGRLERHKIIVNKNTIPFDTRAPFDPSGIRLGTPAETTRGRNEKDFKAIARKIDTILRRQFP